MTKYYNCTVEPLKGRSGLSKFFQKSVSEKANIYSNRRVTLNERFSLIERGFKLTPLLDDAEPGCSFKVRQLPPRQEFVHSGAKKVLCERSHNQQ